MQTLTNDQVRQLISVEECIPIIEELFKDLSSCQMPPKIYLDIPNGDFRAMPAVVKNTAGIKWCGVHLDKSGNKRRCNIFAKVLINDINSGELLAIMDAEALTSIRTAAVTGVATKYISHPSSKIAAFIGCGNQTKSQIKAVCAVRDIREIRLFDLNIGRSEKMKENFSDRYNVVVCKDLDVCVRVADIVTTLTPSKEGFLDYEWLKKTVHVNAVGADAKGKRELKPSVLNGVGFVVYDNWEQCSHSGEIQYVNHKDRKQDWESLGEVVSSGWNVQDIASQTLFDATGLAIEDVITARYIYEKVK